MDINRYREFFSSKLHLMQSEMKYHSSRIKTLTGRLKRLDKKPCVDEKVHNLRRNEIRQNISYHAQQKNKLRLSYFDLLLARAFVFQKTPPKTGYTKGACEHLVSCGFDWWTHLGKYFPGTQEELKAILVPLFGYSTAQHLKQLHEFYATVIHKWAAAK